MSAVQNVLVVGAGAAGSAVAIALARAGVRVDLIDAAASVNALGSGITLQGNALRELRALGVWEACRDQGYAFEGLGLRAPDPAGTLIAEIPELRTGGDDLPATMGMYRPALAQILIDRAAEVGARVRFGTRYNAFLQDDDGVHVDFADGSTGRYDLLVGADGINSQTRRGLGIDVEPRGIGLGIWRCFGPRPESVTRTDLIYGGPSYIAGYCPTSEDTLYAYIVEDYQDRSGLRSQQGLEVMRSLAEAYHGPWDEIRDNLTDASRVHYTRFSTHVVPAPWHRGRVVLIGDAAHTCPPTIAQGAAQAFEDAAVLADVLVRRDTLDADLWAEFTDRRFVRAEAVVDASMQLAQWQLDRERGDVPSLMRDISQPLATPA